MLSQRVAVRIPAYEVRVNVYGDNAQVKTKSLNSRPRPGFKKKVGSVCSGRFTKAQQRTLLNKLIMIEPEARVWAIFTYPREFPMSYDKLQSDTKRLLRVLRSAGYERYVGGYEFQKRGAAHINLVLTGYIDHMWLKSQWSTIVGSADPRHFHQGVHLKDIRSSKGERFRWYITGYIGKDHQKEVPEDFVGLKRWGFWSRHFNGSSESIVKGLTHSEMCEFIDRCMCSKNAFLKTLNEGGRKKYSVKEQWGLGGLTYTGGAAVVKQVLQEVINKGRSRRV